MRARFAVICLLCAAAAAAGPPASASVRTPPMVGRGMFIWYVNRSDGGNVAAIIARARAAGVLNLYIKGADGSTVWSQFSAPLVRELHAAGLNVCAWQYVYGADPVGEADAAAVAIEQGADCFVIDAEVEYEGRYSAAQTYMTTLRAKVGEYFPMALASFPYVDYHPAFPYSVFLGPNGAQYDMPQMYWRDIGSSIESVYDHTYTYNRIYGRPIVPLGQTDSGVTAAEAELFRGLDVRYQAPGVAWWDYAWTSVDSIWSGIQGFYTSVAAVQPLGYPLLSPGSNGDDVVRLQELLARVFPYQRITGTFGSETQADLQRFQAIHGLYRSGSTDAATWRALLALRPVSESWVAGSNRDAGGAPVSAGGGASRERTRAPVSGGAPVSAKLPPVADEIRPEPARREAR
jgi:hypothetical protein